MILGPTKTEIEKIISGYLGVKMFKAEDGTIHLTQPHLIQSILKDIAYAVYQCTPFVEHPTKLHREVVKHIRRYLLTTPDKGLILNLILSKCHLIVGWMCPILENGANTEKNQAMVPPLPSQGLAILCYYMSNVP